MRSRRGMRNQKARSILKRNFRKTNKRFNKSKTRNMRKTNRSFNKSRNLRKMRSKGGFKQSRKNQKRRITRKRGGMDPEKSKSRKPPPVAKKTFNSPTVYTDVRGTSETETPEEAGEITYTSVDLPEIFEYECRVAQSLAVTEANCVPETINLCTIGNIKIYKQEESKFKLELRNNRGILVKTIDTIQSVEESNIKGEDEYKHALKIIGKGKLHHPMMTVPDEFGKQTIFILVKDDAKNYFLEQKLLEEEENIYEPVEDQALTPASAPAPTPAEEEEDNYEVQAENPYSHIESKKVKPVPKENLYDHLVRNYTDTLKLLPDLKQAKEKLRKSGNFEEGNYIVYKNKENKIAIKRVKKLDTDELVFTNYRVLNGDGKEITEEDGTKKKIYFKSEPTPNGGVYQATTLEEYLEKAEEVTANGLKNRIPCTNSAC